MEVSEFRRAMDTNLDAGFGLHRRGWIDETDQGFGGIWPAQHTGGVAMISFDLTC